MVQKKCAKYDNIHTYCGDAGDWLPKILSEMDVESKVCTLWLDAHPIVKVLSFSNTPILKELSAIKNAKLAGKFKVLIDDLRLFSKEDRNIIIEIAESIGEISYESNIGVEPPDILVITGK